MSPTARRAIIRLAVAVIVTSTVIMVTMNIFKKSEEVDKANAQEIYQILSENPDTILEQLELEKIELSFPLDGKQGRVLVRVQEGESDKIPESIVVDYDSKRLEIPLEVSETYEPFTAQ